MCFTDETEALLAELCRQLHLDRAAVVCLAIKHFGEVILRNDAEEGEAVPSLSEEMARHRAEFERQRAAVEEDIRLGARLTRTRLKL